MKDLNDRIPCSVSQETVLLIANAFPERYKRNNAILITKLLFDIGFKIDMSMRGYGYYRNFNVLIRDNYKPHMLYKTSCVYNGTVRNTVKSISLCGKIEYTRCRHPLYYLYERHEILQPKDLSEFVNEEKFVSIDDVGCELAYNKAFLNNKNIPNIMKKEITTSEDISDSDTILEDNTVNTSGD